MRSELTYQPLAARFSNSGWGRPLRIFICGTAIFLILIQLPVIRHYLLTPLAFALAWLLNGILTVLGEPVHQLGTLIIGPAINMEITPACTGLYQISFLWIAILSWPAPGSKRLSGFVHGALFLLILNIFRIISIYYGALLFPSWIPFFHDIFWEGVMILMVPFVFLMWMKHLPLPVSSE